VKVWPFAAASAAACGLGLFAALLVPGEARAAALWGAGAATVSGACALTALVAFAGNGLNGLLAGFTAGFLVRAAMVALGLVASGARGNLALVYVGAFFILYAATQVIEVLFVQKRSRA
jgi:hypothetical protein